MNLDEARKFALALPSTTEEPHFEMSSFRVNRKIFATVPTDGEHLHIFVDENETRACVSENHFAFEELWWGKKLAGLRVALANADGNEVFELLTSAWRRKAPKNLIADFDGVNPQSKL